MIEDKEGNSGDGGLYWIRPTYNGIEVEQHGECYITEPQLFAGGEEITQNFPY
mgnify:CR=1 FL=1